MDLDSELPNNHRNHQLERLSEIYFDSIFPTTWIKNKFQIDYGTDYNCEIAREIDNGVTGMNFTVQMKGKETESNLGEITVSGVKRSTINRWLNRLEPTMIVVYLEDEKEAYWIWFENNTVDLTHDYKTFTIKLPRANRLSQISWKEISEELKIIFSRKNLLYEYPKIDDTNEKAWALYFEKRYEEALPLLKEISKEKPNGELWNAIALCQYILFSYQEAFININKSIEFGENFMNLSNKAAILTEQGFSTKDELKIQQAIEIYERLLKMTEASAITYYNYGSALTKVGTYENAKTLLQKAIELDSNNPTFWNNLGNVYMHLEQHQLEMICYDNALQLNPELPETLFTKGSSLFKNFGQVEVGLALMLKASELSTRYQFDFPYLFWWISEAYTYKNETDNAILWNKKGLNTFSTDPYLLEQNQRLYAV